MAGTYHYKIDTKALKAAPFGETAEGMPECSGATLSELEKAIYDACKEKSGFPEFNFNNSQVTKTVALWTACIGTAKGGGGGGGGDAPVAAAAAAGGAAAKAKAPEPEPEEEEEDMGFDLVRAARSLTASTHDAWVVWPLPLRVPHRPLPCPSDSPHILHHFVRSSTKLTTAHGPQACERRRALRVVRRCPVPLHSEV
jgi:hypothetical protein